MAFEKTESKILTLPVQEPGIPQRFRIDATSIGHSVWESILEMSKSGTEHGAVVSHIGKQNPKILVSRVTAGYPQRVDEEHYGRNHPAQWIRPHFPHGFNLEYLLALIRGNYNELDIHAHPRQPQIMHLMATPFTPNDISGFMESTFLAKMMIEQGNVFTGHMLLREPHPYNPRDEVSDEKIYDLVFEKMSGEYQLMHQMLSDIAHELERVGIRYFVTHQLEPDPQNFIHFTDVRHPDALLKPNL